MKIQKGFGLIQLETTLLFSTGDPINLTITKDKSTFCIIDLVGEGNGTITGEQMLNILFVKNSRSVSKLYHDSKFEFKIFIEIRDNSATNNIYDWFHNIDHGFNYCFNNCSNNCDK